MPRPAHLTRAQGLEERSLQLDEDGFLLDPTAWSAATANLLAEMESIENLGPEHWAVINYLRQMHFKSGGLPVMSRVCRTLNLGKHGVHRLFGSCRKAWRIAGLPNPGEEAKAYMT